MGMFDLFNGSDYEDDTTRLADRLARTYFMHRTVDRGLDALGGLYENAEEKRHRQGEELDLRLKRRALGLPMDDDDYEDATNDDIPFATISRGARAAKAGAQLIPEQGFLGGSHSAGSPSGYSRNGMREIAETFEKPDEFSRRDFLKLFAPAAEHAPPSRMSPLTYSLSNDEHVLNALPLLSTGHDALPASSVGFRALGKLGSKENGISRGLSAAARIFRR